MNKKEHRIASTWTCTYEHAAQNLRLQANDTRSTTA
jgi:hypothetical protein